MSAPWESGELDELFFYSRIRAKQWLEDELLALVIEGNLGAEGAAEELIALLLQAGAEPIRGVILDLRKVTFLPSKVLPALMSLRTELTKRGGILAITAPTDRIGRLLGLVGLEKAILISADAEEVYRAVRSCLGGDSPAGAG